jgi:hypothetical protein
MAMVELCPIYGKVWIRVVCCEVVCGIIIDALIDNTSVDGRPKKDPSDSCNARLVFHELKFG